MARPDDDDDRPVETSARRAPKPLEALKAFNEVVKPVAGAAGRKRRALDPRRDKTSSSTNPNAATHQYGFLQEMEAKELGHNVWTLRQVRRELKRRLREKAIRDGEGDSDESSDASASSGSDGDDDNGDDGEVKHFSGLSREERHVQRIRFGLLPEAQLRQQEVTLKKLVLRAKGLAGEARVKGAAAAAKRSVVKRELAALASGKKTKAYFPKRAEMQRAVAEIKFDEMAAKATSGSAVKMAATKAMERQAKRSVRGTRHA